MTVTVTITEDGRAVGGIDIDGDDIAYRSDGADVVHPGAMVECGRGDVLRRVAHAASHVAEYQDLLSGLEALGQRPSEQQAEIPEEPAEPWSPSVREKTAIPCIVCGGELEDESAGNNQPVRGLAFQSFGHWPSSVFDAGPGWLEINLCEPCMKAAAERRFILNGDRESRRGPAVYKVWDWPKGG